MANLQMITFINFVSTFAIGKTLEKKQEHPIVGKMNYF